MIRREVRRSRDAYPAQARKEGLGLPRVLGPGIDDDAHVAAVELPPVLSGNLEDTVVDGGLKLDRVHGADSVGFRSADQV